MAGKLRHLELTIAELEREVTFHLDDLDAALALMAKMADLYPRLEKQQGTLLQILAKRIIVDPQGTIIDHELNSSFVYLLRRIYLPGNRGWQFGACPIRGTFVQIKFSSLLRESIEQPDLTFHEQQRFL